MKEKDLLRRGFKKLRLDGNEFCYHKEFLNAGFQLEVFSGLNGFTLSDEEGNILRRIQTLRLLPDFDWALAVNDTEIKNLKTQILKLKP